MKNESLETIEELRSKYPFLYEVATDYFWRIYSAVNNHKIGVDADLFQEKDFSVWFFGQLEEYFTKEQLEIHKKVTQIFIECKGCLYPFVEDFIEKAIHDG